MLKQLEAAIAALDKAPRLNIKGKQYSQVATRVEVFRRHFGLDYSLTTEVLESGDPAIIRIRATIATTEGVVIATGLAEEDRRQGMVNKTSALENAETSAIGRALAAFGLHGGEYASAGEVQTAIANQNAGAPKAPNGRYQMSGPLSMSSLNEQGRQFIRDLTAMHKDFEAQGSADSARLDDLIYQYHDVFRQMEADAPSWLDGVDGEANSGIRNHLERFCKRWALDVPRIGREEASTILAAG